MKCIHKDLDNYIYSYTHLYLSEFSMLWDYLFKISSKSLRNINNLKHLYLIPFLILYFILVIALLRFPVFSFFDVFFLLLTICFVTIFMFFIPWKKFDNLEMKNYGN